MGAASVEEKCTQVEADLTAEAAQLIAQITQLMKHINSPYAIHGEEALKTVGNKYIVEEPVKACKAATTYDLCATDTWKTLINDTRLINDASEKPSDDELNNAMLHLILAEHCACELMEYHLEVLIARANETVASENEVSAFRRKYLLEEPLKACKAQTTYNMCAQIEEGAKKDIDSATSQVYANVTSAMDSGHR